MIKLNNDEHVIFEIRKHWFTFGMEIVAIVFLAFLPILLFLIFKSLSIGINLISSTGNIIFFYIFVYSAWLFILWIAGFVFWTDYYLDTWIITTKRVIDIEQHGMFRREISIVQLDKIQDVKSDVHGIIASIMNFGDIHIQTAGQQKEFLIHGVPEPDNVRHKLNEALSRYNEGLAMTNSQDNTQNNTQNNTIS
ncbi:MAG TPA: PH domain-containing protein [Candidatus Paceibacterota bacterium]|nr:PH domain-containing protein [Candidatus Paceibacterota bacterium]